MSEGPTREEDSSPPALSLGLTPEAVRPYLEPALPWDAAHDWHHLVRVFNAGLYLNRSPIETRRAAPGENPGSQSDFGLAGHISPTEQAKYGGRPLHEVVLRLALLAHDLGVKTPTGNAPVGPEQVAAALGPVGACLKRGDLEQAVSAINEHSWSRGLAPTSLEAAVLQDADRLDAIGAVGVARCLAYGGAHGRPIRDPGHEDCVRHFHDKLLRIGDRLNLEASRALARRRHDFLVSFLAELERDCEEFRP